MEQHPIPRQITTFEFKLIGFMTLKQFLYLVAFIPSGFIVFKIFPIPVLNFLAGLLTAGVGVALAFLPFQDKPLDQWIKNLWKRLNAPTQYFYHKNNPPFFLVSNLYYVADPHKVMAHIESREKLAAYIAQTAPPQPSNQHRQSIQQLLKKPSGQLAHAPQTAKQGTLVTKVSSAIQPAAPVAHTTAQGTVSTQPASQPATSGAPAAQTQAAQQLVSVQDPKHPSLLGLIKNNKKIALPGILIYVKDSAGTPLRLLKTNPHGVFASFHPLPLGEYTIEVKDPKGGYFFDTMKLTITDDKPKQVEIFSKEML